MPFDVGVTPRPVTGVLREARELVARGWTTGSAARDYRGESVDVQSERASSFCVVGALQRAVGCRMCSCRECRVRNPLFAEALGILEHQVEARNDPIGRLVLPVDELRNVARYNDSATHEQVLQLFDDAIDSLEVGRVELVATVVDAG